VEEREKNYCNNIRSGIVVKKKLLQQFQEWDSCEEKLLQHYDHNFFFKLKNSKVFYERVGIKALNQTVFVDHLICIYTG
jgi:hypothetical protein